MSTIKKPRVYLAGKISDDDWRNAILPKGIRGDASVFDPPDLFELTLETETPQFIYTGPYFISCDHRCAHGPRYHGVGIDGGRFCIQHEEQREEQLRRKIFAINKHRLRRADLVFAFITSPDCHGTLIELGLAVAAGKRIGVAFSNEMAIGDVADLWMAKMCAPDDAYFGTVDETFWRFFHRQGGLTLAMGVTRG